MNKIYPGMVKVAVAFFAIATLLHSCSRKEIPETILALQCDNTMVEFGGGSKFIKVVCNGEWTIAVNADCNWATLDRECGKGDSNVILKWTSNQGQEIRSCTITANSGNRFSTLEFSQRPDASGLIVSDPVAHWLELPAVPDGLYFIHHPMTMGKLITRNYSYAWDKDALVAHWVAYPLNRELRQGSSGRQGDPWGLDPKIPEKYQPDLRDHSYSGFGVRGHQIPSGDRQQPQSNLETFYGVNLTPQDYTFNGGTWLQLENYVREKGNAVDTLYVATGCVIKGSTRRSFDNDGKEVTVPVGYFKALLGYKKTGTVGISGSTGGYTGIAFYYDNKPLTSDFMEGAMTIRELEKFTGMDYFVNLPQVIGSTLAEKVEITNDDWWKK